MRAYGVRMLVEASCFALIALGLTIQWGYAGLFNVGVMGFIATAAFISMLVSFPINGLFWNSDGPALLGWAILYAVIGVALTYAASQTHRLGLPKKLPHAAHPGRRRGILTSPLQERSIPPPR